MKVEIDVSEENWNFLKEFMNRVKTQDNRGTASPYYFTVCCKKEVAVPEGSTGNVKYYDSNSCESYTYEELKKRFKEWNDDDDDDTEWNEEDDENFEEYQEKYCQKYDVDEDYEYENVFFTEKGYEDHIKLNGHNYRHFKKYYSYVKCAFRNPEIEGLFKALEDITKE